MSEPVNEKFEEAVIEIGQAIVDALEQREAQQKISALADAVAAI